MTEQTQLTPPTDHKELGPASNDHMQLSTPVTEYTQLTPPTDHTELTPSTVYKELTLPPIVHT